MVRRSSRGRAARPGGPTAEMGSLTAQCGPPQHKARIDTALFRPPLATIGDGGGGPTCLGQPQ